MQVPKLSEVQASVGPLRGLIVVKLHTVAQFPSAYPAFTEAALRNLIFKAEPRHSTNGEIPGNGLIEAGAIVRIGRKVLIDEDRFFDGARQQNGAEMTAATQLPHPETVSATVPRKPTKPTKAISSATVNSCRQSSATSWQSTSGGGQLRGQPRQRLDQVWFGRPWHGKPRSPRVCRPAQTTTSVSRYSGPMMGPYRRQKAHFQALHAVMLDDVGTKVAKERLTLPPSWLWRHRPVTIRPGTYCANP